MPAPRHPSSPDDPRPAGSAPMSLRGAWPASLLLAVVCGAAVALLAGECGASPHLAAALAFAAGLAISAGAPAAARRFRCATRISDRAPSISAWRATDESPPEKTEPVPMTAPRPPSPPENPARASSVAPTAKRRAWLASLLLAAVSGAAVGVLADVAGAGPYTAAALASAAGFTVSAGAMSAARRLFRRGKSISARARDLGAIFGRRRSRARSQSRPGETGKPSA